MAQVTNVLAAQTQGPSLNTSKHAKDHAAARSCTLTAGDAETGEYLGLDASQSSQTGKLHAQ